MLKYLLILSIFVFCAYTGMLIGKKYLNRYRNLQDISKYSIILQNEILYKNTPLPEAFLELSYRSDKIFSRIFSKVSEELIEGTQYTAYDSFKEIYKESKSDFYFTKDDEKMIGDFLKVLGESGIYGQKNIFELFKKNLEKNLKEAEAISKKNSKLYSYLGVLTGAMIAIFLI